MPLITKEDLKKGEVPKGFAFSHWGVGRLKSGEGSDYHFHDCDEYWFIIQGQAKGIEDGVEFDLKAGDCVYTPMGHDHQITATTDDCINVWFAMEYRGKQRHGHLHRGEDD